VQGRVPFQQNAESRQFSNRAPGADTLARGGRQQNTQFARFAGNSQGPQNSNVNGGNRGGLVDRGANTRNFSAAQGSNPQVNGSQVNNGQGNGGGGWRRFDPTANANRNAVDRGANTRGNNFATGPTNNGQPANNSQPTNNASGFRQQNNNGRSFSNSGTLNGSTAGQGGSRNPVQINPPIVRNRGDFNNSNSGGGRYAIPSQSFNDNGAGRTRSAPQIQSAPQQGPSRSFNGGGTRSSGGGVGAAPSAPPRVSAPSGGEGGGGGGGSRSSGGSHGGGVGVGRSR